MRAYHPAGFSASPTPDWHPCTSSWSSRWDGWTNTKEMLNGSGGLCPKKPCGSSAAAVRGQKRHGMSQQAARNIPSRGWAQHLLQQDVEQTSAQERFGKEIPFSLRHACSKLWNTTSCGKITQGRAIASSPVCTWLDTCSSSFFHISMEMTPCLSGRFYFTTKPQRQLRDAALCGTYGSRGSRKGTSSMWRSRACPGDSMSPVGQAAWKNRISSVVFCSLGYKPQGL